jgi:hypothetical protein
MLYLAIRNMEKKWTRQPQYWNLALNSRDRESAYTEIRTGSQQVL